MREQRSELRFGFSFHFSAFALPHSAFLLLCVCLTFVQAKGPVVRGSPGQIRLRVVKVVEEEYYLLTRGKPIDVTVSGPVTLRVVSRVLFPDTLVQKARYSLMLESQEGERFLSYEGFLSKTRDEEGRRFGKARSLSIAVPVGTHHFRLSLFSSPKETCAVRFVLEKVRWEEVRPESSAGEVFVIKRGEKLRYYRTPVKVKGGSLKLLVRSLIGKGRAVEGETLALVVRREGKESLPCGISPREVVVERSPRVKTSTKEAVSTVKAVYLELEEGEHEILFPSGIVRIYRKKKE